MSHARGVSGINGGVRESLKILIYRGLELVVPFVAKKMLVQVVTREKRLAISSL